MTLSICITTWNSMKFIKDCLESIFQQSIWFADNDIKIAVNIVDNGSQDETVDFIRKNYPQVHILKNINNLGFCKPYNQAIKMHYTDWVLVMNPDVILEKDFLEKILLVAKKSKPEVGSLGGKILKVENIVEDDGLLTTFKSDKIDSFGLEIKKSRQVKNIGENEIDKGQFDEMQQVFGFSGACVLYRREVLEDIKIKQEYFDEDFFAYQDDFDISYRLQIYGWQAMFVASAKAYHFRSTSLHTLKPWHFWKIIKARRSKSKIINYHSYKNHLCVLVKNEFFENFLSHLPHILWFEFKKIIFLIFFDFDFKTLFGLKEFFKLLPKMRAKRKIIMSRRKVSSEYIRSFYK